MTTQVQTFNSAFVWPLDLYEAARETCLRLYVANGGDANAVWTVQPYPGTAAINVETRGYTKHITLCMPAFPLNKKLPRWKADLILAYTVHELLHALYTVFSVMGEARKEGLHSLVNAIEDNRIEAKAGKVKAIAEARGLLEALTAHIVARAADGKAVMNVSDERNFSFILNNIIFTEILKYDIAHFPRDWRARVPAHWLPSIDMALKRFPALVSTHDVLALARDLRQAMPQAPAPQAPKGSGEGQDGQDGQDKAKGSGEGQDGQDGQDKAKGSGEGQDGQDKAKGSGEGQDGQDGQDKAKGSGEGQEADGEPKGSGEGQEADGEPKGAGKGQDGQDGPAPESTTSADGGHAGGQGAKPDVLSDNVQDYSEASLDDLSSDTQALDARERFNAQQDWIGVEQFINAPKPNETPYPTGYGDVEQVREAIKTPAKLRRHVTNAVKSLERVGYERRQSAGRFDMREIVPMRAGASDVFKRRVETQGQEAAVSLLLDDSGSMADGRPVSRRKAAAAMALHMAEALRAANVKFEIAAFENPGYRGTHVGVVKSFAQPWNDEAKKRLATYSVAGGGGTSMMPAMRVMCERLRKHPNVTRRVLLTLTDGQDSWVGASTKALVKHYAKLGVENIGIGLLLDTYLAMNMQAMFMGQFVAVSRLKDLSERGLGELVRILDKGAPRDAA